MTIGIYLIYKSNLNPYIKIISKSKNYNLKIYPKSDDINLDNPDYEINTHNQEPQQALNSESVQNTNQSLNNFIEYINNSNEYIIRNTNQSLNNLTELINDSSEFVNANPLTIGLTATSTVVGATLGVLAAPAIITGSLGAVGLSTVGSVAGGIFASIQTGGMVTAGGVFAGLQSFAMGGAGAATIATSITGITATGGAVIGAIIPSLFESKSNINELDQLMNQFNWIKIIETNESLTRLDYLYSIDEIMELAKNGRRVMMMIGNSFVVSKEDTYPILNLRNGLSLMKYDSHLLDDDVVNYWEGNEHLFKYLAHSDLSYLPNQLRELEYCVYYSSNNDPVLDSENGNGLILGNFQNEFMSSLTGNKNDFVKVSVYVDVKDFL